jgi:hypothetical protein
MSKIRRLIENFRRSRDPLRGLDEQQWLAGVRAVAPPAVAVVEPEWRGVYSSTVNLFPACLPVLDGLTKRTAARIADLILETGVSRVVFAEMPRTYKYLLDALERGPRKIEVYATWYNSFMMSSPRSWKSLVELKELVVDRRIKKIGFAKSGMADVFNRLGVPASFVVHAIAKTPSGASDPLPGGPHLGVAAVSLARWRKLPFAMLAAATEIPGAVVHAAGANDHVENFAKELRIDARVRRQPVPQDEMPRHLSLMHLNLYVTLSECCPMLPLESLSEGVPCLFGPNSHLFEDAAYLHSRLVVPYPERNEVIADYIRQALAERDDIIAAYRRWAPRYWQRSQESVAAFLDVRATSTALPAAA